MYTYEYEHISSSLSGWGPLAGTRYWSEGHKAIIDQRAKEGWRYVGFIPALQRADGLIEEMDLVFEKEVP